MTSRWRATLASIPIQRPAPTPEVPHGMCLDKGYDDREVRALLDEFSSTAHIRARGEEAQALKREAGHRARRWVVERTHSWMNRFRRILICWEKKPENYLGLLHLVCALLTYRAVSAEREVLMARARLCRECGKQPVVPYHERCQGCLVRLAARKPGQ